MDSPCSFIPVRDHAFFGLMLHAHIPYCRKSGTWPAGEEWLFEAMLETYIPLLRVLRGLQQRSIKPRAMIGVVPVLAEQLADPYMNDRFCQYIEDKILRADNDTTRFSSDERRKKVASYYHQLYTSIYRDYKEHFFRNIIGTLKWLQEEGTIEVIASAATHGFLPLLERDSAVYSQVHLGVATYEKHFGCRPKGMWLPECAYRPRERVHGGNEERRGIDDWLADEAIQYFFVEDVGITGADFMENKHGEERPSTSNVYALESGVCVFGRNAATGKQVWSPDGGYPGHPAYLEFHQRDAETGLRYWRVTGGPQKDIYDPGTASSTVDEQARHFTGLLARLAAGGERVERETAPTVIVSPYDCELFGHWWHEGVSWISRVYEELARQDQVVPIALGDFVAKHKDSFSVIRMKPSTWGLHSDFTVWQNPAHGWIWPYINSSCKDFEQVLADIDKKGIQPGERESRVLKQAGRELLLMEGSDWPFLLFTLQAKDYANQRFHHHHQRFNKLLWAAKDVNDKNRINDRELGEMEDIDNPWPDLDVNAFKKR